MNGTTNKALEILKSAILLEMRGKSFYSMMCIEAKDQTIKDFFEGMASEEDRHIEILSEQFKSYRETKRFIPISNADSTSKIDVDKILTQDFKSKITAAGSEAAAITAAILMEKNATKLYAERSEHATDPDEKALYKWLSDWEQDHIDALFAIEQELKELIWNDNNFWPM